MSAASSPLLPVEEYLERVVALAPSLPSEEVPVNEGFGRTLAETLVARVAVPPFDNSAMDGFAVRIDDVQQGGSLPVSADVPAGSRTLRELAPGSCARIMTGAPMPLGADTVVPVELTDQPLGSAPLPETVTFAEAVERGRNVRARGENVAEGDEVLIAGQRWTAEAAASAASIGYGTVPLRRRTRVAVLATGSELVAAGAELAHGQIPDSNSVMLAGLVQQFGGEVAHCTSVPDDPETFRAELSKAMAADIIVTTGGVSVGAYEVVRQVVQDIDYVRVAMQPGQPQASGAMRAPDGRSVAFLGLPGNPVAAWVSAWIFLRSMILATQGQADRAVIGEFDVAEEWPKRSGRWQYVPVQIVGGQAVPTHRLRTGSHLVATLSLAQGIAMIPPERESSGTRVQVLLTV